MCEISGLSVYLSLTHSSTALFGEDRVPLYEALLLADAWCLGAAVGNRPWQVPRKGYQRIARLGPWAGVLLLIISFTIPNGPSSGWPTILSEQALAETRAFLVLNPLDLPKMDSWLALQLNGARRRTTADSVWGLPQ
jgi:hypothetical protein